MILLKSDPRDQEQKATISKESVQLATPYPAPWRASTACSPRPMTVKPKISIKQPTEAAAAMTFPLGLDPGRALAISEVASFNSTFPNLPVYIYQSISINLYNVYPPISISASLSISTFVSVVHVCIPT